MNSEEKSAAMLIGGLAIVTWILWQLGHEDGENIMRVLASVPAGFRFAVKAPRAITHEARLSDPRPHLREFFDQISALGQALGPVLIQMPPSLQFDMAHVENFQAEFRQQFDGDAVLEPRHATWFEAGADELLCAYRLGRVATDPAPCPEAAAPGGWAGLRYWRLHGSPQMYYTSYGEKRLRCMAARLSPGDWCVFDNTASGAAIHDALLLQKLLRA